MQKSDAVAAMGPSHLLLPAWIKASLAANDRLKLYLTVLQAAAAHAEHPDDEQLDLDREMRAAGAEATWLRELPQASSRVDGAIVVPDLPRLAQRLAEDLGVMARPLLEAHPDEPALAARVRSWQDRLATLGDEKVGHETLTKEQLCQLTDGKPRHDRATAAGTDSFHVLVMDLHKRLNQLAAALASEVICGAHVWQLRAGDRPRVEAFMRGLERTAPLKLDHPGLDTAATRDGDRLLLQNDIGTNDAHVLVVQVEGREITLQYSDLHVARFEFFQSLLAPFGATWTGTRSKIDADLNEGHAYTFGTARFECVDDAALDRSLEGIGSQLVFLIDWNRARKRLLPFVGKAEAVDILREAARCEAGHMGWLKAGGEDLVFAAMEAVGNGAFRIGDRLDAVLGKEVARAFLIEVLRLASKEMVAGQPAALVADETRLLLARHMRQRSGEFDLVDEHAAYCHALAQAISDGLAHDVVVADRKRDERAATALAARAKVWERRADHLVMQARDLASHQRRWQPFARLLERSDDIADALEEAAFLMSLIAEGHHQGWNSDVHQILARLAQSVLSGTQEHVKSLAIARRMGAGGDPADGDAFLAASWAVLRCERECDELLRTARRTILGVVREPAALMLANDLAMTLELASDRLLGAGYALRDVAFDQAGVPS